VFHKKQLWNILKKIAHYSSEPLIIYNIPQCTHNKIELNTVLELAKEENIAGIKDSSGDFISFTRGIYTSISKSFSWIQGEEYLDGLSFKIGADGVVAGLGNVFIEPYIQMYKEVKKGNYQEINEIQGKINKLYEIINVTRGKAILAIKAGTVLIGRSSKWMKTVNMSLNNDETKNKRDTPYP